MNISTNYALKSLLRSTTRTFLSLTGIGIGCAIALIATAWIHGEDGMMAESTAMSGQGYLQLVPENWQETRDPRLRITGDWHAMVQSLRKSPGVTVAAPQADAECLLGMGTKVQGVNIVGVDPEVEPQIRRAIAGVTSGKYLQKDKDDAIVVGSELANRLDVETGDELVVTCVAPSGDMNSSLLTIEGIISTGSRMTDASIAHVVLGKAIALSGRQGINRVSMLVNEPSNLEEIRAEAVATLKNSGATEKEAAKVLMWTEVNPALVAARQGDAAFSNAIIFVIVILVILGITSAQLTGVLQRGREFSALLAIGMPRIVLWRLIFTEACFLGFCGGLLALGFAALPLWYLTQVGVNIAEMSGSSMELSGVLLDPVMKAKVGPWALPFTFLLAIGATLLGAVYPAIYSMRLDAASILRSRN